MTAHQRGQADQGQELAEVSGGQRTLVQALDILGVLARTRGEFNQWRYHLENSVTLGEQLDDSQVRVAALNNLALVFNQRNETERAITLIEEALVLCT